MEGFYGHKGMWFPTQHALHQQQQMYGLAPASNMPINPHLLPQALPYRFHQRPRGRGFSRPPFPHHVHPQAPIIHPTPHVPRQAGFHPPQNVLEPQENPPEHHVMPDNREIAMGGPQSIQSNVSTQNYVSPSIVNSEQQAPSSQYDVSKPPPLMDVNLGNVAPPHYHPQSGRKLQPQQNAGHEYTVLNEITVPHQSHHRGDVNRTQNAYQQPSHGENFQHIGSMPGEQPPRRYKQQRKEKHYYQPTDGNSAAPYENYNPNSSHQQSSDSGNFQPETWPQQPHKQKKKKKNNKKKPWVDGDSSEAHENWDQNDDSYKQRDDNLPYEMPPRHQGQHRFRHDERGYNQQPWGGPVPYQDSNQYHHRGRGRGYRGRYPRENNYNYKPRHHIDYPSTPQVESYKDCGKNEQENRNSDLLQEQAPLESPAMVAEVEKIPEENSFEAIVDDIVNSATPEEGSVIVEAPEENQVPTELPDLSYINTMHLAELQSLCSDICSESNNFWGPLEQIPHMVNKIETVIEIIPQKCKDQSKIDVLVQDMQRCLSLLESRAPMIESAGNNDYDSSDGDEEDDMHRTVSHIGMEALGLYTRVRLNPVPTEEVEIKILQQQITKCQTDLDQLPIAEDNEELAPNLKNIHVLCNDAHDLLLHRATNAPSKLYSYST